MSAIDRTPLEPGWLKPAMEDAEACVAIWRQHGFSATRIFATGRLQGIREAAEVALADAEHHESMCLRGSGEPANDIWHKNMARKSRALFTAIEALAKEAT